MDSVEQKLQQCLDTLISIKESGYWPFASPAPCSTEVKIKDGIVRAIGGLENAIYWHQQEFGRTRRDPMEVPNIKIVERWKNTLQVI